MAKNNLDALMSTHLSIKDLTLKQGGIELHGASNSKIENVRIINLFGNNRDTGISIKPAVNLKIKDVKIFRSTRTGILYEDTAGTGPSTTSTFEDVWVSHCKTGMVINGNTGGSLGVLTSSLYNSIIEYNDIGLVIKGTI